MKDLFEKVGKFNEAFGVPEQESISHTIPDEDRMLYHNLLAEENDEYFDAVLARDKVEVADALTDELCIVIGKFRKHGIPVEVAEKLFEEVYQSNMSKLGPDGKPIYREDGKVLKGESYFKPKLGAIIDAAEGV